jgi:cytochrome c oxidase cbb3-type subunit 3
MKKINQILIVLLLPVLSFAQQNAAASAAPKEMSETDYMWWLFYAVAIVLLFAVLVLGNVLVKLTKVVINKNKMKGAALILLLLSTGFLFAQDAAAPAVEKVNAMSKNWNLIMASSVLLAELFVVVILALRIRKLLAMLSDEKEAKAPIHIQLPNFLDSFNASVAIEKEHDILLDHNYDGIRELDNNLPPWWKYGFYFTIVWGLCYLVYFNLMGGPTQVDEYNTAMNEAKQKQEALALVNKNKVDENHVTLADAAGIAEGKSTFETNCAACHGKVGEGLVGPNLTDDYWLHGGSLNDVFKSVKYGWSAKGMKAWEADLSAVQIKNVVSYIKSLHGTNPPNAKAAQGDLYQEGGAAPKTDSTAVAVVDTTKK